MPGIQLLAIRRRDGEGSHLALRKSKLLSIVDIVPAQRVDFVGVESADPVSF